MAKTIVDSWSTQTMSKEFNSGSQMSEFFKEFDKGNYPQNVLPTEIIVEGVTFSRRYVLVENEEK